MSIIRKISVHAFQYTLENFGKNLMTYQKGGRLKLTKFITAIETDDGLRGEYAPHYMANAMTCSQVCEMAPMLIGRNADHRSKLFQDLKIAFRHFDGVGIAAIDSALWDLAGKKLNCPISQLLGGYREKIPAYASTFPGQTGDGGLDSIQAYADFASQCRELGYPAFKIHGFWDGRPDSEIAIMTAVRKRVDNSMRLMTDPASSLATFLEGVEVGRACDDLKFFWYEDPFRDGSSSVFAHRRLRELIKTPLLISEHVRGFEQKADFLMSGGTDMIHIDPELDGGITGTMKLANFAEGAGMDVQIHTAGPIHRHCLSAIPNTHYYEMGLVGPDMFNSMQPPIYACGYSDQLDSVDKDGCVSIPTKPGLGVTYDWDKIKKWEVGHWEFCG